jgi:hypothetical protein
MLPKNQEPKWKFWLTGCLTFRGKRNREPYNEIRTNERRIARNGLGSPFPRGWRSGRALDSAVAGAPGRQTPF